jgi:hypothetical protein
LPIKESELPEKRFVNRPGEVELDRVLDDVLRCGEPVIVVVGGCGRPLAMLGDGSSNSPGRQPSCCRPISQIGSVLRSGFLASESRK